MPRSWGLGLPRRKEPIIWKPADIGVDAFNVGVAGRRMKLRKIFQPAHADKCEFITGTSEEDAGANLAKKLAEMKLL